MSRLAMILATWFGSGLMKPAPGTWGTLAALPFAAGLSFWFSPMALLVSAVCLFPIGVWAAGEYDAARGGHDASEIVVDEVVGVWITLSVISPSVLGFAVGFLLFRLFDIWKPWPIRWADRTLVGGFGVMIDDVLAGLMAALLLFGISQYIPLGDLL